MADEVAAPQVEVVQEVGDDRGVGLERVGEGVWSVAEAEPQEVDEDRPVGREPRVADDGGIVGRRRPA